MDHAAIREQVFALYDGELAGPARQEAEDHCRQCAECRALYGRWAAMAKTLFRNPQVVPSEFFVQRVMDRVELLERSRQVVLRPAMEWRWFVPALGMAAVALCLVLQPQRRPVSLEGLLFIEVPSPSSWVLSNDTPTAEDILKLAMGGDT